MITRQENGITVIRADEGKWLQKGDAYSNTDIYLGTHDAPENWVEVDSEPSPPVEMDEGAMLDELEVLLSE